MVQNSRLGSVLWTEQLARAEGTSSVHPEPPQMEEPPLSAGSLQRAELAGIKLRSYQVGDTLSILKGFWALITRHSRETGLMQNLECSSLAFWSEDFLCICKNPEPSSAIISQILHKDCKRYPLTGANRLVGWNTFGCREGIELGLH